MQKKKTMAEKIKTLYKKYEEFIMYVLFGVFTTIVNIVIFWLFADVIGIYYLIANMAAWLGAVLFAYVTNRKWVFKSKKSGFKNIFKEMVLFIAGRLLSGVGDMIILYIFVDLLKLGNLPGKIASQIFVVIFNYVFSKLIIFKSGNKSGKKKANTEDR